MTPLLSLIEKGRGASSCGGSSPLNPFRIFFFFPSRAFVALPLALFFFFSFLQAGRGGGWCLALSCAVGCKEQLCTFLSLMLLHGAAFHLCCLTAG